MPGNRNLTQRQEDDLKRIVLEFAGSLAIFYGLPLSGMLPCYKQESHRSPLPDGLISPRDAAEYLRLSAATLANWRTKGGGPRFLKVGRLVGYRKEDLKQFLDDSEFSSTSEYRGGAK